jgi:hypothetical protein
LIAALLLTPITRHSNKLFRLILECSRIVYHYSPHPKIASGNPVIQNNKTGGDQPDSGATNVGSSGAADTSAAVSSSSAPAQTGTGGTGTSGNAKGTTNATADSLKTNPK